MTVNLKRGGVEFMYVINVLKYWFWSFIVKGLLGIVYIEIIAEGLRQLVPALGQKLYKIPGLSFLQNYEETYRLDMAPIFALFLMISVWSLWSKVLEAWLLKEVPDSVWDHDSYTLFVSILAIAILGADAFLFYFAVTKAGWGGSSFSFTAIVATSAYLGVLIFVSFVSLNLTQQLKN